MSSDLSVIEYDGLEIIFDGRKPLLTQAQMAYLFGISRDTVSDALQNAQKRGFIDLEATTRNFQVVAEDGVAQTASLPTIYRRQALFTC